MKKVLPNDFCDFIHELLCKSKVDPEEAWIIAKNLVWSDQVGRYTHGTMRLPLYLQKVRHNLIVSPCKPEFLQKTDMVYIIDGNNGFGQYLGYVGMCKAIDIAKEYGIGVVAVTNSNHFGPCSYFIQLAAENFQLGFAVTNAFAKVAPYGGISGVLGTNPFAFGAPTEDNHSILIDFSTSAISGAMIREAIKYDKKIPEGFMVDKDGKSIVYPKESSNGVLFPFGEARGYCIGLMVEILSGVITGSCISHEITSIFDFSSGANKVGHLFIALDISKIMSLESYFKRISCLIRTIKTSKKMNGFDEILIPGETRWRHFERQKQEGIQLDAKTINELTKIAKQIQVNTPW